MAAGEFYAMEYDAWDEGTVALTLEEEAAFLRICHQIYRRQQPIPNSNKLLCVLWRCHPNKAKALLQRLIDHGKITIDEQGRLTNHRTAKELHVRDTFRTRKADAGRLGGTRSGEARRKSLENNDQNEAKRTTGQDSTVHNKTEEKDGAGAPVDPPDKVYYRRAREVLGKSAGGVATNILKAFEGSFPRATNLIERAAEKDNPMSFVNKALSNMHDPTRSLHPRF